MGLAFIVFFLSLLGISLLFALKSWEIRRARIVLPALRQKGDMRAAQLKELLDAARVDLSKLPPEVLRLSRIVIHQLALGFAALARATEKRAHVVADLVSYKHRYEKQDTRSEFLKKVSEHKNGGSQDEAGNSSPEL